LSLQLTDDGGGETVVGETTVDETVTGVSNNRGVDGVSNNRGVISGGGVGDNGGSSVVGLSLIGHIGNIAVIVVGVVLDVLDPAVGKVDGVLAIDNTGTVVVLSLLEGSSGVVISNSVGVGVGGDLGQVIGNISGMMGHGGMVGGGGVHHRGVVGGGSVDGVSDDGGVDSVSDSVVSEANSVVGEADSVVGEADSVVGEAMVGKRGVDGVNSVGNNSISSVKSVGGISHDGGVSSEGLALGGGPVLSLVGLAHGLVAHLAVSVSVNWLVGAIVDGGNSGGHGSVGHSVSNDRGVHSVGHDGSVVSDDRGGVDGVSNNGSSVDGVSDRGVGGSGSGVVSGGGGGLVAGSGSLGVDSGSLVGHISDIAVIAVGRVGNLLDSAVRKGNGVRSLDIAGTIGGLLSVEVGLGVVISNGVGVGVGGDLIGVSLGLVGGGGGVVSRGMDHGGSIGGSSVHSVSNNRGGVMNQRSGVMDQRSGVMDQRSGVHGMSSGVSKDGAVGNSVSNRGDGVKGDNSRLADRDGPVSAQGGLNLSKALGVIDLGHGGVGGAEGLGLDEASLLTVGGGD